jgi:hypothetical protein
LPLLAWRPGALTRRYVEGERARFVSPIALFLFSVFLMFAVFQIIGIGAPSDFGPVQTIGNNATDPERADRQVEGLRTARREMGEGNPATPILDNQIAALEREVANRAADDSGEAEVLEQSEGARSKLAAQRTGWDFFDRGIDKWRENPGLMAYKLQANSYKFSWLLIPLSVPFVWLIFAWRRKFGAYDHAVFVTYSLSFMTLLFITLTLLSTLGLGGGWILTLATTVPIWHIYRQIKGAYGLSRFSAVWRTVVLLAFIGVILFLFLDALLLLGALG